MSKPLRSAAQRDTWGQTGTNLVLTTINQAESYQPLSSCPEEPEAAKSAPRTEWVKEKL